MHSEKTSFILGFIAASRPGYLKVPVFCDDFTKLQAQEDGQLKLKAQDKLWLKENCENNITALAAYQTKTGSKEDDQTKHGNLKNIQYDLTVPENNHYDPKTPKNDQIEESFQVQEVNVPEAVLQSVMMAVTVNQQAKEDPTGNPEGESNRRLGNHQHFPRHNPHQMYPAPSSSFEYQILKESSFVVKESSFEFVFSSMGDAPKRDMSYNRPATFP
ncbi:uncharacterized protein [Panulirus ornatus]|uniref:uncharacterized protein n=1 Tax=Panulirus ornatus TaxID=150431 RepID=UPI003A84BD1E